MKIRHAYRHVKKSDSGEHLAYRNLTEHVHDPRDLMPDGTPHSSLPPIVSINLENGEVEFDHEPSEDELKAAFPAFFARVQSG